MATANPNLPRSTPNRVQPISLSQVIRNLGRDSWRMWLLWKDSGAEILPDTQLTYVDSDDYDAMTAIGWVEFLDCGSVMEVLSNAEEQNADATVGELIDAVRYYWHNDAFIDWSG